MAMFGKPKPSAPDLDSSTVVSFYTNDTHVASSDDEVILSLGVRPFSSSDSEPEVPIQRVYMTFFSAKRFLVAVQMAIERHEKTFGSVPIQRPSESIVAAKLVARAVYANFARVTGSPEELTVEFGVNPHLIAQPAANRICVHSQVVLSFASAKLLSQQISRAVQDYEARHGELQLDVSKRIR